MGIVDEDIVRVREATDIVAIISQYTQLKRVGRRFSGLCPFHAEKSPSFSVNAEQGLYYCFGCAAKGDAISFLRDKEQLDFVGAVERLAQKSGVTLRYTDAGQGESRKRRQRLIEAIGEAVDWYHSRLLKGKDAGPARSYLRQRGYERKVVEQYQIGWAPDSWDDLCQNLSLSDKDLKDAGLGFTNKAGRSQDAFRARIMFPIFDAQNNPVGFGGRKLPDGDGPKYKNSFESDVYSKSSILYGLNWAKNDIVKADHVLVCEGYTDVIGFGRAGLMTAVATCGTALTENHVKILRRFGRRVILAFDADTAGQNAAARFYEWEKSYDLDVYVAALPPGVDPGSLAESDPELLRQSVTEARPFLDFQVNRVLVAADLTTAEGRVRAVDQAFELVVEHPEPLVRDQYVLQIAAKCRLDEGLARERLKTLASRSKQDAGDGFGRVTRSALGARSKAPNDDWNANHREYEALKLAVQGDDIRKFVDLELFTDERSALVYELTGRHPTLHTAIAEGGPEVGDLLQRLSVEDTSSDPIDVAGLLWERYLATQIDLCRVEARSVSASSERFSELNQEMNWFKYRLEDLRDVKKKSSTVEALLAWIQEESGDVD